MADRAARLATVRSQLEAGTFSESEQGAQALLDDAANDAERVEALYLLAVARRYNDNLDGALDSQRALLALQPQHARAHQEQGHTLLSRNRLPEAQRAYERAVNLNPALTASWQALLNLYALHDGELNDTVARHQRRAQAQLEYLLALPPELVTVLSHLHEQRLQQADRLCRAFLRKHPQHLEGMRLLARIGEQVGVLADAEFLLETALELDPAHHGVRFDYANVLLKMQKFDRALTHTERLTNTAPDDLAALALHANALAGVGRPEAAIEVYNRVIAASPGQHRLLVMRGHAEKTTGQLTAAVASYRAACSMRPSYGDAYWSLANTKSYSFSPAEQAAMRAQIDAPATSAEDRIHLLFALGKALEDSGDYAASFACYEQGNALKQASVTHKPEYLALRTANLIEHFDTDCFARHPDCGAPSTDPIFIVGLPRAGSTLIEQILASHSQVDGTMELPHIIALVQRLRRGARGNAESATPPYPALLDSLPADYFRRFGEQFIADTRVYRAGAPRFIDKNPNNFFHIGLIRLILPNARIIDARRHPMACCFSGFKQLFGQGQEFSYGLREIGNYYREYVELMAHWERVLPGHVLRVQHEDLVDDLEGQVRRLLDFCGLPFENACLEFHNTRRHVRTPSSEQVRQPIYRTALEAWRPFDPWLGPLKDALGPELREVYGID